MTKETQLDKVLVVVESPAKARTITKYLGDGYKVKASVGHVRDLPVKELGIETDDGFKPKYVTVKGKSKVIKELRSEATKSSMVLLATDMDREGEAIAWHLEELLKKGASGSGQGTTRHRHEQGRCPAGAQNPRQAGRVSHQPRPLEDLLQRAECRTCPERRFASDMRA